MLFPSSLPYSFVHRDRRRLRGAVVRQLVHGHVATRTSHRHDVPPPPLNHLSHEGLDGPEVGDDIHLERHLHLIWKRPSEEIFLGLQRYKFPDSIVCQDLDFVLLLLQTNLLIFS